MDGWMRTDGWMAAWIVGWMDAKQITGWMDRCKDVQMHDKQIELIERQMDGLMDKQINN